MPQSMMLLVLPAVLPGMEMEQGWGIVNNPVYAIAFLQMEDVFHY